MEIQQERRFAVLLVDDEPNILSSLKRVFQRLPYDLFTAEHGLAALEVLKQTPIDVAFVDLMMPHMDGMTLLAEMRAKWPHVRVLMLTGYGGVKEAVAAIKLGAVDFLEKPFEDESLRSRVDQFYQMWLLERENRQLKEQVQFNFGFEQLIGTSLAILNLKRMILQVAHSDASILIQGETGTGKELVARAIHHHSARAEQPFVPVDCASINETVMGSELFGHVKGAFTGAIENTTGLIRSGDKGTVFLDEVGELSPAMQVKLLRAIQEKKVRRLGASQEEAVNVRIISATHQSLAECVEKGRLRHDLYYRLNVIALKMPPLREMREDVPLLARAILSRINGEDAPCEISPEAMDALSRYDFPGNVRELENVLERAAALCSDRLITLADLQLEPDNSETALPAGELPLQDYLDRIEKAAILEALGKTRFNRTQAAKLLGVTFRALRYRMERLGIK